MKKYIITIALAAGFLLSSCGASKSTQRQKQEQAAAAATHAREVTASTAFTAATAQYKDWQTVEMPVKANITEPMSMGCSARLQMIRDKYIGLSVRMLGFEVAYLIADTDSVHAYVKVKKSYISESISNLFKSSGYTLGNLQDLMMGRIFSPGAGYAAPADRSKFVCEITDGFLLVQPAVQPAGAEIGFALLPEDSRLLSSVVQTGAHSVAFTYGDPVATAAGPMPEATSIDAQLSKNVSARVDWDLKSAKWNRNITPRKWKTPSGARRISVTADLLRSLIK